MALNIKNTEVERLAAEIADLTGESKTEAIRKALSERRSRMRVRVTEEKRKERIHRFLMREVWARIPQDQRGRAPAPEEIDEILGYGESGV